LFLSFHRMDLRKFFIFRTSNQMEAETSVKHMAETCWSSKLCDLHRWR
jgi:hypothetical protein